MKSRVDERLRVETAQYGFVFGCESCAHFDAEAGSCGNGYPNTAHAGIDLEIVEELEFCKQFELA